MNGYDLQMYQVSVLLPQAKTKLWTHMGEQCSSQPGGSGAGQTWMLPNSHQVTTVTPGMGLGPIRDSGGCCTGKAQCLCFNKVLLIRVAAQILTCKWPSGNAYFSRSASPESLRGTALSLPSVLIKHSVNKKLQIVHSK